MNSDTSPPIDPQEPRPPDRPARGADASLLTFGILGLSVFIVLIAALLWFAGQQKMAVSGQEAAPQPQTGLTLTARVLLPIAKSGDRSEEVRETPLGLPSPPLVAEPSTTPGAVVSPTLTLLSTRGLTGSVPAASSTPTQISDSTPSLAPTQTRTPTTGPSPTPTETFSGSFGLSIRKDRLCVETRTNTVYIFGEIVNNTPQAYDILDWSLTLFDDEGVVSLGSIYFDMPTQSFVFANSAIPFAVSAQAGSPSIIDYDLHLDFVPGQHIARGDLRIDEYASIAENRFTRISGKWSHTDVANPPEFVSIIGVVFDDQGRLINMNYVISYITVDPRLPPGQHEFNYLYLENNPCGDGTLAVSIIGE